MFEKSEDTIKIPGPRFQTPGGCTYDRQAQAARATWEAYGIPEEYQYLEEKKYRQPEAFLEHKITSIYRKGKLLVFENNEEKSGFFKEFSDDFKARPPKKILINAAPIWEGHGDRLVAHLFYNLLVFEKGHSKEVKNVGVEDLLAYKPYSVLKESMYLSWGPVRHFFTPKEWKSACKFMDYMNGYHRILTASIATDPDDPYGWVHQQMGVDPTTFDYIFEFAVEPAKFDSGSSRKPKAGEGRVKVDL